MTVRTRILSYHRALQVTSFGRRSLNDVGVTGPATAWNSRSQEMRRIPGLNFKQHLKTELFQISLFLYLDIALLGFIVKYFLYYGFYVKIN